ATAAKTTNSPNKKMIGSFVESPFRLNIDPLLPDLRGQDTSEQRQLEMVPTRRTANLKRFLFVVALFVLRVLNLLKATFDFGFVSRFLGVKVVTTLERLREAIHPSNFSLTVMGVLIALPVSEAFHQPSGGIPNVKRNGIVPSLRDIFGNASVSRVYRIGLWRSSEVDNA